MEIQNLVPRLEEPKFTKLFGYLAGAEGSPGFSPYFPVTPILQKSAEIWHKVAGEIGQVGGWTANWFFQIEHMPFPISDQDTVRALFARRLRAALTDLRQKPGGVRELTSRDIRYSIGGGGAEDDLYMTHRENTYFFFTNLRHDFFRSGEPWTIARDMFRDLMGIRLDDRLDFGIGTPDTMCEGEPEETANCLVDLLNLCSNYYIVAREGHVSIVPTLHRGQYFSSVYGSCHTQQNMLPVGAAATWASSQLRALSASTISDFEALLNSGRTKEEDIQRFLETNPQFLFTLDESYAEIRPHVCLVDSGDTQLIPDFMARVEDTDIWDIIELKLPHHRAVVDTTGVTRASAIAARAIAQVLQYREWFSRKDNRCRFHKTYGSSPYEPCLVVVIGRGRSRHVYEWKASRPFFPKVTIVSYDYMLEEARQLQQELALLAGPDANEMS